MNLKALIVLPLYLFATTTFASDMEVNEYVDAQTVAKVEDRLIVDYPDASIEAACSADFMPHGGIGDAVILYLPASELVVSVYHESIQS
ncbi:hypothetical protein BVX98_03305, partial [bacterium F11]